MFLKSLELQGFKSFADKTTLVFEGDITAIVGPNGSGKSNISDAIRWVLGEQSTRSLRGAKMEDVIFGGTQKRAGLGFAEAALVLDNSDGSLPVESNEVMITRRYFRSGESEYFINKQSARLRDINEMFMDTGLGKEGYSNIGQGKIDEILSLKSTDRREIFEEASGISRYRYRKEDTEKKLAVTEENLLRIGDKINEIELQLGPLKEQADKAEKYLGFKAELKKLEITLWIDELSKISAAREKAERDWQSAEFILKQEHDNLEKLFQKVDEITIAVQQYDEKLDAQREAVSNLTQEIQQCESNKQSILSEISNIQENIERTEQELSVLSGRTNGLTAQIEEINEKVCRLETAITEKNSELERMRSSCEEIRALGETIAAEYLRVQLEIQNKAQLITKAISEKDATAELQVNLEERKQSLQEELQAARRKQDDLTQQALQLKRELREDEENAVALKNSISGYTLRLNNTGIRAAALREKRDAKTIDAKTVGSRLTMLTEMEKDYDGFTRAVKDVMQESAAGRLRNIHGPVSKLLRTDNEYALAIEIALGSALQDIVVTTDSDGKAAVNYLKKKDIGRATFLPISVIRGNKLQESKLDECYGYIGIASELVTCDKLYVPIITYLLGRTVVVEDLDSALPIAKKYSHRFKIVTLDGQVINAGGSMTGGSKGNRSGILSRANEIDKLKADLEKIQKEKNDLESSLADVERSLERDRYESSVLSGQLREAEDAVLKKTASLSGVNGLLETLEDVIRTDTQEYTHLEQRIRESMQRTLALETEISRLNEEKTEKENELTALQKKNDSQLTEAEQLNEKAHTAEMLITGMITEQNGLKANKLNLENLLADLSGDNVDKQSLISGYRKKIADFLVQIEAAESVIEDKNTCLKKEKLALELTLKKRNDLEAEKTAASGSIRGKNEDVLQMERESARLQQKMNTMEQSEKIIIDKLWDNYNLTVSTAQNETIEIESVPAAQRKASELRRKISGLGTPNLGAIEEYNRINDRFSYLSGQRDDVSHAKQNLLEILHGITREMTNIFVSEFGKINRYFGETFTEMFSGGKAELVLEDENSPLDCGIEIRVQPPGKQVKTITLLSGGEKAFVAIALYFAILKVRPTPFCMLDEIDAALDDRNVERFAEYLHTLSKSTQFIVITHRRGTMEASDTLYGVTMQEQGISKMLHLNMAELAEQLGLEE